MAVRPHGFHYDRIANSDCDTVAVAEALSYFRDQYDEASVEMSIKGRKLNEVGAMLPGYTEFRYAQWRELSAILELVKRKQAAAIHEARQRYLEHYQRTLSDNMANRYAENDPTVAETSALRIEVELVQTMFEGMTRAHVAMKSVIYDLTQLRSHQIEDAII